MVSGGLLKVAWGGSLKGFRDGFFSNVPCVRTAEK